MSSVYFIAAVAVTLGLAGLLAWALRGSSYRRGHQHGMAALERVPQHLSDLTQIRQAMDAADLEYARSTGGPAMFSRLRRERRQVVFLFLAALRSDFEQSLRLARIIAALSPEVSGAQEYERLRLAMTFRVRYQLVKLSLLMGGLALPQVTTLGQMAASLAMQMEQAMAKLGERAALAAELALRSDR
jgi:hypothetical protein